MDRKASSTRSVVETWFAAFLSSIVTPKSGKTGSRAGRASPSSGDEIDSGKPGLHICGALVLLDKCSACAVVPWKDLKHARGWPKNKCDEPQGKARKSAEILASHVCRTSRNVPIL